MAMKPSLVIAVALLGCASAVPALGADHYLCYKAALAKDQPRFLPATKNLEDRFGGPQTFTATKIVTVCNPADTNGSGIAQPTVHQEGFTIKAQKGTPKFVRRNHAVVDPFGTRTLTLTGAASLLDVTPKALGTTPPAPFASDPTSDPSVNRFACYRAKVAKGSGFVAPPPPTVTDQFFTGGQVIVVSRVTKLCVAVDKNGETPGAESRDAALVCYRLMLPKGTPKFVKTTVATNDANFSAHVLVASKPVELCMAAVEAPTPTPAPTPTAKRVFATSSSHTGGFGGSAGADAICAARASAAGLAGTFKAWVAVSGSSPASSFVQSALPYQLVDGTTVALDWADLVDGGLAHAINQDENGDPVFADVWTGTDTAGGQAAATCNNWSSASGAVTGQCGSAFQSNGAWTASSLPSCNTALRLYCFEQ